MSLLGSPRGIGSPSRIISTKMRYCCMETRRSKTSSPISGEVERLQKQKKERSRAKERERGMKGKGVLVLSNRSSNKTLGRSNGRRHNQPTKRRRGHGPQKLVEEAGVERDSRKVAAGSVAAPPRVPALRQKAPSRGVNQKATTGICRGGLAVFRRSFCEFGPHPFRAVDAAANLSGRATDQPRRAPLPPGPAAAL